ncbi:hypothetical protein [Rhabdothermincola sediminis]|uniref:hypothetical protein n=1 Tax=Rhabdothermincola sediminis TaxID=2751370 RepID=UPI001AA097E7|nr:hypothetical protein [Rhabdothermincola sediminis]
MRAEPFGELRRLQDDALARLAVACSEDPPTDDEWHEVSAAVERYLQVEERAVLSAHERSVPFGREQARWARERHHEIRSALLARQSEHDEGASMGHVVAALRQHVDIMNAEVYPRLWRKLDRDQLFALERRARAGVDPEGIDPEGDHPAGGDGLELRLRVPRTASGEPDIPAC